MTDKLEPCQKCGSDDICQRCDIWPMYSSCYCWCGNCGTRGPAAPSQEQARAAWNEQQVSANVTVSANGERGDSGD